MFINVRVVGARVRHEELLYVVFRNLRLVVLQGVFYIFCYGEIVFTVLIYANEHCKVTSSFQLFIFFWVGDSARRRHATYARGYKVFFVCVQRGRSFGRSMSILNVSGDRGPIVFYGLNFRLYGCTSGTSFFSIGVRATIVVSCVTHFINVSYF